MTILEELVNRLVSAAAYNRHDMSPPRVIFWTDQESLWSPVVAHMRAVYPHFWTLGEYDPGQKTGPAAFLRYLLGTENMADGQLPVFYLPGVSRASFRTAMDCPASAIHLYGLQYEAQFFTQRSGRDWTPLAFLQAADGGLGLDVASDNATKDALLQSLGKLAVTDVEKLKGKKLEAPDFQGIVVDDPVRNLLLWMSSPELMQKQWQGPEWNNFRAICKSSYGFDPEADGVITAAESLARSDGAWAAAWKRFREAPKTFSGVGKALYQIKPPEGDLFVLERQSYPQINQEQEDELRKALEGCAELDMAAAQERICKLTERHLPRCQWVWSELGDAPLANALKHLHALAVAQRLFDGGSTWRALEEGYTKAGWGVDANAIRALAAVRQNSDAKAVTVALRALYLPWLEKLAIATQALAASYPNAQTETARSLPKTPGTMFLFVDGLRYDIGQMLVDKLQEKGLRVTSAVEWSALPTVTATAKYAWQPLAARLVGGEGNAQFQPSVEADDKAISAPIFRELLNELGLKPLIADSVGDGNGCAWTEVGSFDRYGHDQGWKLAWRVGEEVDSVTQRVMELIGAGWQHVRILTDHGWLLLPGGLPKVGLPKHLTESCWGRCASPEPGAQHGLRTVPWFWNGTQEVVLAPGVSCFLAGKDYAHGGLTLQEALIPTIQVEMAAGLAASPEIEQHHWSGLRLKLKVRNGVGFSIDLRRKAAVANSSVVKGGVTVSGSGDVSMLVEDVDGQLIGTQVFCVILNGDGDIVRKVSVTVGENDYGT